MATTLKNLDGGIVWLAVGQTLVWAGLLYSFPALLLRWETDLEWSKPELTGAITVALLCSAFCSPLAGRIIDRSRGPHLMAGCALIGGIALFCLCFVELLWQFYLVWAVIGATLAGCLYEPCFALITRAYGQSARQYILIVTLVAGFASTLCFPSAYALTEQFGWRVTVQVFALVVVFAGAPALWFGASRVESKAIAAHDTPVIQFRYASQLLTPTFLGLSVSFALLAIVHGATIHHLLHILSDRGLAAGVAVLIASFIGPMQVVGRLVILAFSDRASNYSIAICCFIAMALAILFLMAVSRIAALAIGFVVMFGAGYGMVSVVRPAVAREVLGGDNFGLKSGLLALVYLIGSAIAPYLGSVIWTVGGYNLVLMVQIGLAIAGLLLFRVVYFNRR